MVLEPASWLNVWGPERISQQLSIRVTAPRGKNNILKWPLHWVVPSNARMGNFFFVSLVSPGHNIQSREIGAALSVRTGEWFVTTAVVIWAKCSDQIQQLRLRESRWQHQQKIHHLKTAYHLIKYNFTNSNSQPSRIRILRKTIYFILRIGEAFWAGSMPLCSSRHQSTALLSFKNPKQLENWRLEVAVLFANDWIFATFQIATTRSQLPKLKALLSP